MDAVTTGMQELKTQNIILLLQIAGVAITTLIGIVITVIGFIWKKFNKQLEDLRNDYNVLVKDMKIQSAKTHSVETNYNAKFLLVHGKIDAVQLDLSVQISETKHSILNALQVFTVQFSDLKEYMDDKYISRKVCELSHEKLLSDVGRLMKNQDKLEEKVEELEKE